MLIKNIFSVILLPIFFYSIPFSAKAETYKLYFLAGQSNMVGVGFINELPKKYNHISENVMIFRGNPGDDNKPVHKLRGIAAMGVWGKLRPGYAGGSMSDGKNSYLGERFGPELSFGQTLEKLYPNQKIAIIKYARGGSSLYNMPKRKGKPKRNNWDQRAEGINQYDYALKTIRNAFAISDIDGDGERDTLIPAGIIWMQGESDSGDIRIAKAYEENLHHLMGLLRAALHRDDLPIIIGMTTNAITKQGKPKRKNGHVVKNEQRAFAKNDVCAHLVEETDTYKMRPDLAHYSSEGYIKMGIAFAKAVYMLEKSCK